MTFETIKKNFNKKLWNIQQVKITVAKGVITPQQYLEITGETYTERE